MGSFVVLAFASAACGGGDKSKPPTESSVAASATAHATTPTTNTGLFPAASIIAAVFHTAMDVAQGSPLDLTNGHDLVWGDGSIDLRDHGLVTSQSVKYHSVGDMTDAATFGSDPLSSIFVWLGVIEFDSQDHAQEVWAMTWAAFQHSGGSDDGTVSLSPKIGNDAAGFRTPRNAGYGGDFLAFRAGRFIVQCTVAGLGDEHDPVYTGFDAQTETIAQLAADIVEKAP